MATAAAQPNPFYVIPRTLQSGADDSDPLVEDLGVGGRDHVLDPVPARPEGTVALLCWRVHGGTRAIDPGLVAEFRARGLAHRRVLLAIASVMPLPAIYEPYEQMVAKEKLHERSQVHLAWRVERHWLVEWSDERPGGRPPLLFLGRTAVLVIGSTLAPKLRPALSALSVFPVVTADELRASVEYLGTPPLNAAELSRVLTYGSSVGLLQPASPAVADAYWQARGGRGRRPLRVFATAAAALVDRENVMPTFVGPDLACGTEWSSPWQLDERGRPTGQSGEMLRQWKAFAEALKERGMRTI